MSSKDKKKLELELLNEEVLLEEYNHAYNEFQKSGAFDYAKYGMRTKGVLEQRKKEIETHINELQEKIKESEK